MQPGRYLVKTTDWKERPKRTIVEVLPVCERAPIDGGPFQSWCYQGEGTAYLLEHLPPIIGPLFTN